MAAIGAGGGAGFIGGAGFEQAAACSFWLPWLVVGRLHGDYLGDGLHEVVDRRHRSLREQELDLAVETRVVVGIAKGVDEDAVLLQGHTGHPEFLAGHKLAGMHPLLAAS